MMLRSSSTPILGSLLSSHGENNNGTQFHHHQLPETLTPNQTHKKLVSVNNTHVGFHSFTKLSCNSSPNISPAVSNGLQRAQSEGNLEGLTADEFILRKFPRKPRGSLLEAIPSFSLMGSRIRNEEEESDDYEEEGEKWEAFGSDNFGVNEEMRSLVNKFSAFGVADVGFGSGGYPTGGYKTAGFNGGGAGDGNGISTEEHYKKMVEENPSNPLLLRNYAQFLYQTMKDVKRAEEYYSRAILADPKDGEVLSQYAKLKWEVHRDAETATTYFKRAVQASAGNSHVEAAYANFLWEVEEDDESSEVNMSTMTHERALASASVY